MEETCVVLSCLGTMGLVFFHCLSIIGFARAVPHICLSNMWCACDVPATFLGLYD